MSTTTRLTAPEEIEYPESDGEPMAENTEQYDWITLIEEGLDDVFRDDPNVFVAADLFWYPVEGNAAIRRAPDVMVAFGRPKGRRGAYLQWREGGIAPQVVFEILSPGNRGGELALKFQFYEKYGVEEYYVYDPDFHTLEGWLRAEDTLRPIAAMDGWTSPRLGVRFELSADQFRLYGPDGQPFVPASESKREAREQRRRADEQSQQAEVQRHRADEEQRRADEQQRRADEQQRRAERMAARLRALGIDPEPAAGENGPARPESGTTGG
jgi:Uma2 family endonuclease